MRGRKIISLLIMTATLIFIIACLLFFNANQSYEAERGIEEAIKNYSASIDEAEIKILTKEINDAVEKKFNEMDTKELTPKDLEELLETVINQLEVKTVEYRDADITQEEINQIANEAIKRIIELKMLPSNKEEVERLENYKALLDQITYMQQELSGKLYQTESNLADLQQEMGGKLSQTEGSISNLEQELSGKLSQTENSISDLNKEFDGKLSQTEGSIHELQKELNDKLIQTEEKMNNQKQDIHTQLAQAEISLIQLQNKIGELERLLNSKWEQLEKKISSTKGNILYFDYDQSTQTLNLYGKKGE